MTQTKNALSQPPAARSSGVVSGSLSLSSYQEYPAHHPFVNTPQTRVRLSQPPALPSKALPETNSAAILSALKSLQEKIRRLELDKERAELSLHSMERDVSQAHPFRDGGAHRPSDIPTERERSNQASCNPALISNLAAAEARCLKLEQQLQHMRKMLLSVKADRHTMLKEQATIEGSKPGVERTKVVAQHAQMEKLNRLEREYLVLTHTQSKAEVKIQDLEMKLQEEEHQRKLLQDKANQLQSGMEANRMLLESVSPSRTDKWSVEEKSPPKVNKPFQKSSTQASSQPQSHYRLTMRDVPFVAGKSVSTSHSVRANIQSVLSLLKQYRPNMYDSSDPEPGGLGRSDASPSPVIGEDLSELLQALTDELRLMTLEQDELARQLEDSVSDQERKELHREQERLLLKMERKGEQIHKLHKHRKQLSKLKKEADKKHGTEKSPAAATRGPSPTVKPGEISRRNRRLLRDMKTLQNSLQS
ncbi:centrosomal protein of 57 kDa isoform X2 [Nelusetta ayraudi]|uniref:centrosomal protein of 57 kDa isoform X2 n=1 Tax=Nelusetta ayraudi TaxID=303726 RepID=UPI003F714D5A